MKGVPWKDNPNKEEKEFPVTLLPEDWPSHWYPWEYQFPDVYPDAPSNVLTPPKHKGLDRIFDFAVLR